MILLWGTGNYEKDRENLLKYAVLSSVINGTSKGRDIYVMISMLDSTLIMTVAEIVWDKFRIKTDEVKKAKVELEILTDQANFIGGSKFGQTNLQANWDMFWGMVDTCAKKCPRPPGGGDLVPLGNGFGNPFKEKV